MAKTFQWAAATLGCIFIVAFQLQLLPLFSPLFVNDRIFWPIIYYGCWSLAIGLTLATLATQKSILKRSLPVLVVCAVTAGATFTHPIDGISKNFLVATIFVACTTVLAIASAPLLLLRLSASATVLSAVICLLDALFNRGFTNSVGRAAGLSINANVAAAGLLLGAASSYWAVPRRLLAPFLLIVGAAIFATLSRSTWTAGLLICAGVGINLVWIRLRTPGPHPRISWFKPALLAFGLAGWIVAALFSNDRFAVAARDSFQGIGTALKAFEQARQSIAGAVGSMSASERKSRSDALIAEIGHRVESEGNVNSISARGLLMERALLAYRTGPFFGQGLAKAHELQPHNTFLLFAIAFGHPGWLVPLAFLALTIFWARNVQQLPLFLATLTVMTTSHDILLTPALLAPVVFGMVGLNALRYGASDAFDAIPTMKYTTAAVPVLFAIGGASIAGVGLSGVSAPPNLLLLLVFGATALWSIAVWLWLEKLMRRDQGAVRRGSQWD